MARKQTIPEPEQSKQLRYYHRKRNREQEKAQIQAKKSDVYLWLAHSLKYKRFQAKKAGLPFDLDEEWLQNQPLMCAVTGQTFEILPKGKGPRTPSFDQRLPGKGYTKENTQLVCLWYNTAKNQWPEEQIRALIVEAADVFR